VPTDQPALRPTGPGADLSSPAAELLRVFLAHHVESVRDRRVDADREVVVDDVARHWVPRMFNARRGVQLAVDDRRRRRRTELDLPPIHQHHVTVADCLQHLLQTLALVTCRSILILILKLKL